MTDATMKNAGIDTGQAIGYGWASVKKDFWYFVGLAIVATIIGGLGNSWKGHPNNWGFLSLFLSAWMTCGYVAIALSYQAGKKLPFENLFTNFKPYWGVLASTLLYGIIVGVGILLLIVPGIYFALKYQFVTTLIVDKGLGIGDAFQQSAKMTQGKKMSLLGFDLVSLGVIILGAICLGVGVFVAIPVLWLANIVVYRQLGQTAAA